MKMSRAARSVALFGLYMGVLGLGLMLVPNLLLSVFGMPPVTDVWIRVLGVIVLNLGVYYGAAARAEAVPFFHASVATRVFVLVSCGAFVLLGWAHWTLLLVAMMDALGAVWTALALRPQAAKGHAC